MRIVAGSLRGKKLHRPAGTHIRPTGNRTREAVFNILSGRVRDAVVLDLFAGTGAMGIEALSRGAAFAVFVEKHKVPLDLIARNIHSCRLEDRTKIIRWDIKNRLDRIRSIAHPDFDLVFADPPYDKDMIRPMLDHLRSSQALRAGACVVAEHSLSEAVPENCPGYTLADQRRYGKSLVSFLDYML